MIATHLLTCFSSSLRKSSSLASGSCLITLVSSLVQVAEASQVIILSCEPEVFQASAGNSVALPHGRASDTTITARAQVFQTALDLPSTHAPCVLQRVKRCDRLRRESGQSQ